MESHSPTRTHRASSHGGRRPRRAHRWILALLALMLAPAAGVDAQETGDEQPQVGCLRGRPLPACKSFWIVEMQASVPVAQTRRLVTLGDGTRHRRDVFDNVVEWNLGHMANLSPSFALGGVLTVGSGNSDPLTGIKLRARRWLTSNLSVELEGGLLRSNASDTRFEGLNGATADLRLNIRDQGSFYVRWDRLHLDEQTYPHVSSFYDPGGTQQGVSVGASLGSVPALVGTGVLGLTYVVLFALLIGVD